MSIIASQHKLQVFISYSEGDEDWRDQVNQLLSQNGFHCVYDKTGIGLGKPWLHQIGALIDASQAVVVLLTPNSITSQWIFYEFVWSLAKGKEPIFLALREVEDIPEPFGQFQGIPDLWPGSLDQGYDRLIEELEKIAAEIKETERIKNTQATQEELRKISPTLVGLPVEDVVRGLLSWYLPQITERQYPTLGVIIDAIRRMPTENIPDSVYCKVIRDLMKENTENLLKGTYKGRRYHEAHKTQLMLGELLEEAVTVNHATEMLNWIELSSHNDRKLLVMQYPLTQYHYDKAHNRGRPDFHPYTLEIIDILDPDIFATIKSKLTRITAYLTTTLLEEYEEVYVRLPTVDEWQALAKRNDGWDKVRLRACNLKSFIVPETSVSVVGSYLASVSDIGCYDVLGNVWELCEDNDGQWYICGFSFMNRDREANNWNQAMQLIEKAHNEPVGMRFIAEVL